MESYLLPHQDNFIQSLKLKMNSNFYTIVNGSSGCGKSYAFSAFREKTRKVSSEQVIIFDSNYINEERDYSAFRNSMTDAKNSKEYLKEGVIEVAKDIPFVGNSASFLISSLVNSKSLRRLHFFNEDELAVLNYIKKIINKRMLYVICDNIHWWDRRSLLFLIHLISMPDIFTDKERKKIRFVLSITDNQISSNQDVLDKLKDSTPEECLLEFPVFEYLDFRNKLVLESNCNLEESQIELLYTLVNGHLKVYFEIIREISENSFDFDSSYENNKTYLNKMLERRLKECGASGEQIAKVLEYASIIGITFSSYELEVITDSTKNKIKKIINDANILNLTENTEQMEQYRFAHDIIREVFRTNVNLHHIEYYENLAFCLKQIKPGQYLRRARLLMQACRHKEAAVLYVLELVYQLRTYGNILTNIEKETSEVLTETYKEYIMYMKSAYESHSKKNYNEALKYLNLILSYYPDELLAERDLLKLRCYSKKLSTNETLVEIQLLDEKRNKGKFNNEIEVWERYSHALIIAYAHLGEIRKARLLEEELLNSLSRRIDYDDIARHRMNIIKRNANAIHGIDIAPIFIRQAVDYFSPQENNYRDLKQYYTSLINYSAILIKQGEFLKAYDCTLIALKLENENSFFRFPRPQILQNNFIISGILTEKLQISEGILLYKKILNELAEGMAERVFYASNLSILYALDNRFEEAYEILNQEVQNHNIYQDQEGLYKYRFITNNSIYQYLLGNCSESIKALKLLNDDLSKLINGSFFLKKNEVLIEVMQGNVTCDGKEWLNIVHKHCPSYQGRPWRYFGLGYAFAALCDWGL